MRVGHRRGESADVPDRHALPLGLAIERYSYFWICAADEPHGQCRVFAVVAQSPRPAVDSTATLRLLVPVGRLDYRADFQRILEPAIAGAVRIDTTDD